MALASRPHPSERLATAVLALASAIPTVLLIHRPVFDGLRPSRLPTLYDNDQLGYLAIVTNVAHGYSPKLEPDTISGTNPYPSGYYTIVGLVARVLHLAPVTAWNTVSMLLQIVAFAALGAAIAAITRRPWAALFGPLIALTGCMSWFWARTWMTPINHQGALWGPFGVLFPQNGETAGLSMLVTAMSLFALAYARSDVPVRQRRLLTVAACACAGIAANFQTYGFLTGTYILSGIVAATALLRWRSVRGAVASLLLLVAVCLLGPAVAERGSSLAALVFGLAPMIPGAVVLLRRLGASVLTYPVVFALCAAPMILSTIAVRDTPFMRYRVESNVGLGVASWQTLLTSAPLLLLMAGLLLVGLRRRDALVAGTGASFLVTWPLVSLNDLWGANAEPYRFWIDAYLLGLVALALAVARAASARRGDEQEAHAARRGRRRDSIGAGLRILVAASFLFWAASLGDIIGFEKDPNVAAVWDPGSQESQDIRGAVGTITPSQGRLWGTSCVDLRRIKVITGAPVAFYHLGMAWPDDKAEVDSLSAHAAAREIDVPSLRSAQVRWVVTRNGCDAQVPSQLREVRTRGDYTLWEVSAG